MFNSSVLQEISWWWSSSLFRWCASCNTKTDVATWYRAFILGRVLSEFLKKNYEERWIGRCGPSSWPVHWPNSNPLQLILSGCMFLKVCHRVKADGHQLLEAIMQLLFVLELNWDVFSCNIHWHNRWHHACSVICLLDSLCYKWLVKNTHEVCPVHHGTLCTNIDSI
jgi:hypothetical protein